MSLRTPINGRFVPATREGMEAATGLTRRLGYMEYVPAETHDAITAERNRLRAELKNARLIFEAIFECEQKGTAAWHCANDALPPIRTALKGD